MMGTTTAATALRYMGIEELLPRQIDPGAILANWVEDKGYNPGVIIDMARRNELEDFLQDFLIAGSRGTSNIQDVPWNFLGRRLTQKAEKPAGLHAYNGAIADDIQFRRANTLYATADSFFGVGAAGAFDSQNHVVERNAQRVSVAVVGGGAAGYMAVEALRRFGFESIDFYNPDPLGIWGKENVYGGSRNNPRPLRFFNVSVKAAPGNGDYIRSAIQGLQRNFGGEVNIFSEKVTAIRPGNLNHTVVSSLGEIDYPIVINAMGLGVPKPLSDPRRMTLYNGQQNVAALRWQKVGQTAKDLVGQKHVFIGLGNSTAEMIHQLHNLEDQGYEIDYRILTHYPLDSIMNPEEVVVDGGQAFRVFRDLSQPNLTSYQGDLMQSRRDYFRAMLNGRIVPNVIRWGVKKVNGVKYLGYSQGAEQHETEYNKLYVLTGYHQPAEVLSKFGCVHDQETGAVLYDYDGELVADPRQKGAQRLHKGYFALGAVADAPHNKNTIVIPGMISAIPPMMAGVVMRASELVRAREGRN